MFIILWRDLAKVEQGKSGTRVFEHHVHRPTIKALRTWDMITGSRG